jgi:transcriptional regulator with XRE-family HTH domain
MSKNNISLHVAKLGERIRQYRKSLGESGEAFARRMGIAQGTLSLIENGKTTPSAETLMNLILNSDINPTWLFTGFGKMTGENTNITKEDILAGKILKMVLNLSDDAKRKILEYTKDQAELEKKKDEIISELIQRAGRVSRKTTPKRKKKTTKK